MRWFSLLVCIATFGLFVGCGASTTVPVASDSAADQHADDGDHDHSGWWCVEHGVPEEECALCDTSLVASFKADGDWCDEHKRPHSQCFACDPDLFTRFAARYEAKYGEAPPQPTE